MPLISAIAATNAAVPPNPQNPIPFIPFIHANNFRANNFRDVR